MVTSVVKTVLRSDWDLAQIGEFQPECLQGYASADGPIIDDVDLRAAGIERFSKKPMLVEDVVELVKPLPSTGFQQTGIGPDKLLISNNVTESDLYTILRDRHLYS